MTTQRRQTVRRRARPLAQTARPGGRWALARRADGAHAWGRRRSHMVCPEHEGTHEHVSRARGRTTTDDGAPDGRVHDLIEAAAFSSLPSMMS
eukprot:5757124-Prymnesium_polylepis.2